MPTAQTLGAPGWRSAVCPLSGSSDVVERLDKADAETRPGKPAEFGNSVRDEKLRWAMVVRQSGAKFGISGRSPRVQSRSRIASITKR